MFYNSSGNYFRAQEQSELDRRHVQNLKQQLVNVAAKGGEVNREDFNEIKYWAKLVFEDPSALVFWFDFLDGQKTEVGKYSVSAIGDRAKVVSNDKVKAIYYGDIPNYIFISKEDYNNLK